MRLLLILLVLATPTLAEETAIHEPSGLKFPAAVGNCSRLYAKKSFLRSGGFTVGYRDSKLGAEATLFLYPKAEPLAEQMAGVEEGLKMFWGRGGEVKRVQHGTLKTGSYEGLRSSYSIRSKSEEKFSEARIYLVNDHHLKFRVTGPLKQRAAVQKTVTQLAEAILK